MSPKAVEEVQDFVDFDDDDDEEAAAVQDAGDASAVLRAYGVNMNAIEEKKSFMFGISK